MLADNLGNLWRRLVLPKRIDHWSLTRVQQRLVQPGGRLVKHARDHWLLLAESHLTRRLFGVLLRRIWALPIPASSRSTSAAKNGGESKSTGMERCPRNAVEPS